MKIKPEIYRLNVSEVTMTREGNDPNQRAYVYAWKLEEDFLYVGSTVNWVQRLAGHHVINSKNKVQEGEIVVWRLPSLHEALLVESALITKFSPRFNQRNPGAGGSFLCHGCEVRLHPQRQTIYCPDCEREALELIGL